MNAPADGIAEEPELNEDDPASVEEIGDASVAFSKLRIVCCIAILACVLLQVIFLAADDEGVLTALLAGAGAAIGLTYSLNERRLGETPIATLIIVFFNLTSISGALLVKTEEWSSISAQLNVPILTFSVMLYAQLALIAAHQAYRHLGVFHRVRHAIESRIFERIGLFSWPTNAQLWAMGCIGLATIVLTGGQYESEAQFGGDVAGQKFLSVCGFLRFAPFLIPFRGPLTGARNIGIGKVLLPLVGYFVTMVGISFMTNSRSTFADAIPTVGICALLALGTGRIEIRRISKIRVVLIVVGGIVMMSLLSKVALAMVVARAYRDSVDARLLMDLTFEALTNSAWMTAVSDSMDSTIMIGNYSEIYVDSRFFSRFLLTKFHDNMLMYFSMFTPSDVHQYGQFLVDRLLATLPVPLLNQLGLDIDKQAMIFSNGDLAVYLVDGWGLGGYKTGSMIGELYQLLGVGGFPLAIFGIGLLLFISYDAFAKRAEDGGCVFSPLILLLSWNLVGTTAAIGLGTESVHQVLSGVLRGIPQNILIYLLARALVTIVIRRLPSPTFAPERSLS